MTSALDLVLRLVDAAYARNKAAILDEVNGMLNRTRYLMRVADDRFGEGMKRVGGL